MLHCFAQASSSCKGQGLRSLAVHRLLIVVASHFGAQALACGQHAACRLVLAVWGLSTVAWGPLECGLSSHGVWAWLSHGMWNLPGPGNEPVSPALAGGFLSTAPTRKSRKALFFNWRMESCELTLSSIRSPGRAVGFMGTWGVVGADCKVLVSLAQVLASQIQASTLCQPPPS